MPYIKPEQRHLLEDELEELAQTVLADGSKHYDISELSGRLNYVITELILRTLLKDEESYDKFNSAIGMLESAKLELYARKVRTYENFKALVNGDIPGYMSTAILKQKGVNFKYDDATYEKLLNDSAK